MPDRGEGDDIQQPGGVDEAALAIVARHALHDEELIAAFAAAALDGDDEADERARATSLVERCEVCRAVRDDVAAIGSAVRAGAAFTANAPRDFRLTVADAQRLGGTVVTRGVFGGFRRALLAVARPVGASVAALGLVGVLVGSAVMGAAGVAQAPAADSGSTTTAGGPAASAAAAPSTFEIEAQPDGSPKASERVLFGPAEPTRENAIVPSAWLLIVSVIALIGGVAMFLYGTTAGSRKGSGAAAR